MTDAVPKLDTDRTIQFEAVETFVQALRAALAGEWLIVTPRITIRLQKSIPVRLVCAAAGKDVAALATPQYWRGPFLGMRVGLVSPGERQAIEGLVRELESTRVAESADIAADQESTEPGEGRVNRAEAARAASMAVQARAQAAAVTPVRTEARVSPVPSTSPQAPAVAAVQAPGSTPAQAAVPVHPAPSSPPQAPAVAPAPAPASGGAAPGREVAAGEVMTGKLGLANVVQELLTAFPGKGTGLPVPDPVSLYRLLSVLYANAASGLLEIGAEAVARVYMRRGAILGIDPPGKAFDEYFGQALESGNMVEPDGLKEAIKVARDEGKSLALTVYEKRLLTLDVLSQELKSAKLKCLSELVESTPNAAWKFTPVQKFNRRFDPIRVDLRVGLVDLARQALSTQFARHIEPLMDPHRDHFPQFNDQAETPVEVLSLTDKEQHACQHVFTGANRMTDALSMCLLTRHGAARLLMLLDHFGTLNWLNEASETQSGESIESVLAKQVETMQAADHFERLEVHWAAHVSQFDGALERMRRRYGPQSSLSNRSPEAAALCAKVLVLAEESYVFLKDKKRRLDHRIEHYGEDRMRFAADFLSKQAELNFFRGNQSNAVMLVESALDLVNSSTYAVQLSKYKGSGR